MWNDKEEVKTQDCSTCVNNDVCKYRLVFEQLLKSYKEVNEFNKQLIKHIEKLEGEQTEEDA